MTNLADIAAALRKESPGRVPESLDYLGSKYPLCVVLKGKLTPIPDDIAAAVLIAVMVQDCYIIHRDKCDSAWRSWIASNNPLSGRTFRDSDHGGSLGACYQAWRWSKGLPAA